MTGAGRTELDRSSWPEGVEPLSWANMGRIGVGRDGHLYWDGRQVQTRSRLDLNVWQTIGAVMIAVGTLVGGIGALGAGIDAGHNFGCKVHWWIEGCSK